jgi:hypothetical protein
MAIAILCVAMQRHQGKRQGMRAPCASGSGEEVMDNHDPCSNRLRSALTRRQSGFLKIDRDEGKGGVGLN